MVAIPGASSVEQLESNVAAADIELTDDEYEALRAAAVRFRPVTGLAAMPRCCAPGSPANGKVSTVDDITALILDDHAAFRRGFARLDDARGEEELAAIWESWPCTWRSTPRPRSAILYPHLLKQRRRRRGGDRRRDPRPQQDPRRDRRGRQGAPGRLRRVVGGGLGGAPENSEHLAEEEDEVLPDFRRHAEHANCASSSARSWLTFYGEHPNGRGLTFRDKDPQQYVADHR